MTRIKVCGVTLADDAARVAAAGVDYVGLNFWSRSKRCLALERAALVAAAVRGAGPALIVGVFVDASPDDIAAVLAVVSLDAIQLHGDETSEQVVAISRVAGRELWKALPVSTADDVERLEQWPVEAIVLDAPSPQRGGSGAQFDWALAQHARRRHPARKLMLAGGLRPDNVGAAIHAVQPWAVDVASGVEAAPGVKDAAALAAFVAAVRAADAA